MSRRFEVKVKGHLYHVEIVEVARGRASVIVNGQPLEVDFHETGVTTAQSLEGVAKVPPSSSPGRVVVQGASQASDRVTVEAPMSGKILTIKVAEGDRVKTGDILLQLEAMKMENDIPAPRNGVVEKVIVFEGDNVREGDPLVVIQPD